MSEETREAARGLSEASGLPRPEGWRLEPLQFHRIVVVGQLCHRVNFLYYCAGYINIYCSQATAILGGYNGIYLEMRTRVCDRATETGPERDTTAARQGIRSVISLKRAGGRSLLNEIDLISYQGTQMS